MVQLLNRFTVQHYCNTFLLTEVDSLTTYKLLTTAAVTGSFCKGLHHFGWKFYSEWTPTPSFANRHIGEWLSCGFHQNSFHTKTLYQSFIPKTTNMHLSATVWRGSKKSLIGKLLIHHSAHADEHLTMTDTNLEDAIDVRSVCICARSHCCVCFSSICTLLQWPAAELKVLSTFSLSSDARRFFFFFRFCGTSVDASLTTDAVSVSVLDVLSIANEHSWYHRAR